jgi:hypothetical protein
MSEPYKFRKSTSPRIPPRQRAIVFESRVTRSLTGSERMKVVRQLAHLLMLAAGVVTKESDCER